MMQNCLPCLYKIRPLGRRRCRCPVRAEDAHGCVLWIYAAFLPLAFPGATKNRRTFNGVFTGESPDIGRGRKIYTAFFISPAPAIVFFFEFEIFTAVSSFLFCLCIFAVESLFATSRANESHHPKTPTIPQERYGQTWTVGHHLYGSVGFARRSPEVLKGPNGGCCLGRFGTWGLKYFTQIIWGL